MYKETAGFDYYPQINAISNLSKKEFADKADEALDTTLMILTKDEIVSYAGPQGEIERGKDYGKHTSGSVFADCRADYWLLRCTESLQKKKHK